ncbi:MAG: hypothetical protein C0469_17440 [Cyanobacteria bacterium DS2.3.42]|nr:hypothetical protein [Cyanobacteria bacterium DS2.3.42]
MSGISFFEWQMIKALIAVIICCSGMCVVLHLPIWSYFVAPVFAIGVAIFLRCSPSSPTFKAIENQDWKTLLEICERETAKNPNDANAQANCALALTNLYRFEEALKRVNIAIRLNADLKNCYLLQGMANCGLHNYSEAVADCTKSIELGHTHPAPRLIRSIALTNEYKYDEALKDVDAVLETFPHLKGANLYKAYALQAMYKVEEANKLCEDAFETLSKEEIPFGLIVRSYINARLGKAELAVADTKRLLDEVPRKQECYLNLAHFWAQCGDIKESQANLDKVEPENDFDEACMLMHQARLCLLQNDEKLALKHAERALEKRPSQTDVRATYGLALIKNSRNEEAQNELDLVIKTDPYCAEGFWFRGELFEKLGDEEKAKQDRKVATDYGYIPYL